MCLLCSFLFINSTSRRGLHGGTATHSLCLQSISHPSTSNYTDPPPEQARQVPDRHLPPLWGRPAREFDQRVASSPRHHRRQLLLGDPQAPQEPRVRGPQLLPVRDAGAVPQGHHLSLRHQVATSRTARFRVHEFRVLVLKRCAMPGLNFWGRIFLAAARAKRRRLPEGMWRELGGRGYVVPTLPARPSSTCWQKLDV